MGTRTSVVGKDHNTPFYQATRPALSTVANGMGFDILWLRRRRRQPLQPNLYEYDGHLPLQGKPG